jgi:hypothetical protein
VYTVTRDRHFRGHLPGVTFTARLQPVAEQRAIALGRIKLLERVTPSLPDRFELPEGWAK